MAEQAGPSVTAIRAKQAVLADQYRSAAKADQVLADVVRGGYAGTVATRRRLDTIAAEIAARVEDSIGSAVSTPLGMREMQRFLISKQRELIAVVTDARQDAAARHELLESLPARYSRSPG